MTDRPMTLDRYGRFMVGGGWRGCLKPLLLVSVALKPLFLSHNLDYLEAKPKLFGLFGLPTKPKLFGEINPYPKLSPVTQNPNKCTPFWEKSQNIDLNISLDIESFTTKTHRFWTRGAAPSSNPLSFCCELFYVIR